MLRVVYHKLHIIAMLIVSEMKKKNWNTHQMQVNQHTQPVHLLLAAIHANELLNIIIVVARYYGGINLGIGGLIRAYGACARACLENATLESRIKYKELHVDVPYTQIGTVVTLCKRMGGQVKTINYEPNPNIQIRIKEEQLESIQIQLQSIGITPRY